MPSETTGVIAERYAAALFALADQKGLLDTVASDLKSLEAMIRESADLRRLIESPALSRADQAKAILALAAQAKFDALTSHFLGLLAQNRRLPALASIARVFLASLAASRGEITARVRTASSLDDAQSKALVAALQKAYSGSKVTVDAAIEPDLLGGMIVQVGSRMFDSSLKTKLQHLQLAMKGVG